MVAYSLIPVRYIAVIANELSVEEKEKSKVP